MAISNKLKKKNNNIYVLLGDGECYEGSVWEAAITATENNLDNLFVFIDANGYQNDGKINQMMEINKLANKWEGFGWNTKKIDGHDHSAIFQSTKRVKKNLPTAIICKTLKGKGVNFMENNNDWHHARLTKNIYEKSMKILK